MKVTPSGAFTDIHFNSPTISVDGSRYTKVLVDVETFGLTDKTDDGRLLYRTAAIPFGGTRIKSPRNSPTLPDTGRRLLIYDMDGEWLTDTITKLRLDLIGDATGGYLIVHSVRIVGTDTVAPITAAQQAAFDAALAEADRIQTALDRTATGNDVVETGINFTGVLSAAADIAHGLPSGEAWTKQTSGLPEASPSINTVWTVAESQYVEPPIGQLNAEAQHKKLYEANSTAIYKVEVDVEIMSGFVANCNPQVLSFSLKDDGSVTDSNHWNIQQDADFSGNADRKTYSRYFGATAQTLGGQTVNAWADPTIAKKIRFGGGFRNAGSSTVGRVYSVTVTEVSGELNATQQATDAALEATDAALDAISASNSAVQAENISAGALNNNPVFADYDSGTMPNGWGTFSGGTGTSETGLVSLYGYKQVAAASDWFGFSTTSNVDAIAPGFYKLAADVVWGSGVTDGTGIWWSVMDSSSAELQVLRLEFKDEPDQTGLALGSTPVFGRHYKFEKIVEITAATANRFKLHGMTNYGPLSGGAADAKTITWHRLSVSPASVQEIVAHGALVRENGFTTINGRLQVGATQYLGVNAATASVALQPVRFSMADGDTVTFADMGEYEVDFDSLTLDPLATDESYLLSTENKTGTGFGAVLKISTLGTATAITENTNATTPTGPVQMIAKVETADASNGIYEFYCSGTIDITYDADLLGYFPETGTVESWFHNGTSWAQGSSMSVTYEDLGITPTHTSGTQSYSFTNQRVGQVTYTGVIRDSLTDGTFGADVGTGVITSITNLDSVRYTKQTESGTRTATPNAEKSETSVSPTNVVT